MTKPPAVPFPRVLLVGVPQGQDVVAVKRALSRAGYWPWTTFTPYYTKALAKAMSVFQVTERLKPDGVYGLVTHERLRRTSWEAGPQGTWAFDKTAVHLMNEAYLLQHPGVVCPVKYGMRPSFLHPTGGVRGNYALDFMDPGGTSVYAPVGCVITHVSGHPPSTGTHGRNHDVFGWSLHFADGNGYTYFATHLGVLSVRDGQTVRVAQKLGEIGRWPHDPGRSHLHLGVDAGNKTRSETWMLKIAASPRP